MKRALVALVVMALGAVSSGCSYNRFVTQEEAVKAQWAQVDNQLQRRNDLIPNLVESTKGFAQQERDVFGAIADSRAKLAGAQTTEQKIQAANEQTSALARLLVVVENYPQLRSSETFARLMDELAGTENRISVERMRYNERVQEYNTARRSFPANVTAGIFGFKEYPLFQAPESAKVVPKVDFGRPGATPAPATPGNSSGRGRALPRAQFKVQSSKFGVWSSGRVDVQSGATRTCQFQLNFEL
jgi:LemA protein